MNATWIAVELGGLLALLAGWSGFDLWRRRRQRKAAVEALIGQLETALPERHARHQAWLQTHLHLDEENAAAAADQWLEAEKRFWRQLVDGVLADGAAALEQLPQPLHDYLDGCLTTVESHLPATAEETSTEETSAEETPGEETAISEASAEETAPEETATEEAKVEEMFSDTSEPPEAETGEEPDAADETAAEETGVERFSDTSEIPEADAEAVEDSADETPEAATGEEEPPAADSESPPTAPEAEEEDELEIFSETETEATQPQSAPQ